MAIHPDVQIDLVQIIAAWRSGGRPRLPESEGSRGRLIDHLSRVLVAQERLLEHVAWLRGQLPDPKTRPRWGLPAPARDAILDRGLAAASNDDLAGLALDGPALSVLAEVIADEAPAAWLPATRAAARELWRELGLPGPRLIPEPAAPHPRTLAGVFGAATPAGSHVIEVDPEGVEWVEGGPSAAAGPGRVELEWFPGGRLRVRFAGFLAAGPGATGRAWWKSDCGHTRGTGSTDRPADAWVELVSDDRTGPESGDTLELSVRWPTDPNGGWAVRFVLTF